MGPGGTLTRPLAVSMGDPAGIGPEIIAKSWKQREAQALPPFFAVGDVRAVQTVWQGPVERIHDPHEALSVFDRALPVLAVGDAGDLAPGRPSIEGARCALQSLEVAAGMTMANAACALVTAPISKAQMYSIGFQHAGQTEYVAERCGVSQSSAVMMLAGPTLRVVPITTHVPLAAVGSLLTVDLILAKARVTARGLTRNCGIERPRLAFAGFNPHAGESGALGDEEIRVIEPAIAILREEGYDIVGPLAADTMFHARARATYDAALCCYHDQALIPLKTLHFDEGVNMTLGLPIVRTSPDHGTAFDIAGRDVAEPGAMIAAIRMAAQSAERRHACEPA